MENNFKYIKNKYESKLKLIDNWNFEIIKLNFLYNLIAMSFENGINN